MRDISDSILFILTLIAAVVMINFFLISAVMEERESITAIQESDINDENRYEMLKGLGISVEQMPMTEGSVPERAAESAVSYEMPDIDIYSPFVKGEGNNAVQIVMCAKDEDGDAVGIVKKAAEIYNGKQAEKNGRQVTVRAIEPALVKDFLSSGNAAMDAVIVENGIYGKYLEAEGASLEQISGSLIPDTAVIAIEKTAYERIGSKAHQAGGIALAASDGDLLIAYTNPLNNPTGLNFAAAMLTGFDEANPGSMEAVESFGVFQGHVANVSYSPSQMMAAARSGKINAFAIEKQKFVRNGFEDGFVPVQIGERQDYPLYSAKPDDEDTSAALSGFADTFRDEAVTTMMRDAGFDTADTYETPGAIKGLDASDVSRIVKYWKENKNSGKQLTAVFVSDMSGSMRGEKMENLKKSLYSALDRIDPSARVGFISFSGNVRCELPISPFDDEKRRYFAGAVDRMDTWDATNGTATINAVLAAIQMISEDQQQTAGTYRPVIILLADGMTNRGYSISQVEALIRAFEYPVYVVGYADKAGMDIDEGELKRIAEITGGEYINSSAEDIGYILSILFESEL